MLIEIGEEEPWCHSHWHCAQGQERVHEEHKGCYNCSTKSMNHWSSDVHTKNKPFTITPAKPGRL